LEKVENGVDKVKNKSKVKRFFVYLDWGGIEDRGYCTPILLKTASIGSE
jgi:hypothetical protein